MSADLLGMLARAMLAASAAILIVLALRTPVRRLFGAQAAYATWLLAPAATLASFAPVRTRIVPILGVTKSGPVAGLTTGAPGGPVDAIGAASLGPSDVISGFATSLSSALLGLWLAGCCMGAALILLSDRRFVSDLELRPIDAAARLYRACARRAGPVLVGVFHPRIVVPLDFEQRFDAHERALILAHERAHLAAHDTRINALAALALCLGWFNPLFHAARRFLRIDQELACDERVMARHADQRRAYAAAMLKSLTSRAIPLGCAWPPLGESSIRQRIAMLARPRPSDARRARGLPLLASLMLAACAATSAAQPPRLVAAGAADDAPHAQTRRSIAKAFDPGLCTILGLTCSGVEDAVGDRPDESESSRLGLQLLLALQNGNVEAARRMIEAGADVDFYLSGDGTPLTAAAQKREYAIAQLLIDAGADVNRAAPGDGAPLIVAAARGDTAMAELLVGHGADVNGYVRGDETPLINAARNNHTSVARYLIEQGADVNLAVDAPTWRGGVERRSPLSEAERNHHAEMIRLLRENGARG